MRFYMVHVPQKTMELVCLELVCLGLSLETLLYRIVAAEVIFPVTTVFWKLPGNFQRTHFVLLRECRHPPEYQAVLGTSIREYLI